MPTLLRVLSNPLLLREIRGRWRMPITMPVLFFYALFLGVITYMVHSAFYTEFLDLSTDYGRFVGRRFLRVVMMWQVFAWMIFAPILGCGTISGEREKGLLPGLMLSRLSPWSIVFGKWMAVMVFQVLLLFLPLPIWMIGLSMGGLAPEEIAYGLAIQLGTAAVGAAVGINASAWCMTTARAFAMAMFVMLAGWITSLVASGFGTVQAMSVVNPLSAMYYLLDDQPVASDALVSVLCLLVLLFVTRLLLGSASLGLTEVPLEKEPSLDWLAPEMKVPGPQSVALMAPGTPMVMVPGATATPALPDQPDAPDPVRLKLGSQPTRSAWEQVPVSHALVRRQIRRWGRFAEVPIKEVPKIWVWSRPGLWPGMVALGCIMSLGLGFMWRLQEPGWMDPTRPPGMTWLQFGGLVSYGLALLCIAAGLMTASSFTREREQQTLHELLLTPLSSWQITLGFMQAPLWYFVGMLPWAWLLLAGALMTIAPEIVLVALLFWGCLLFFSSAVGLFFSWIGEHSQIAFAGTLATLIGSWPLLNSGHISEVLRYIPSLHWIRELPIVLWMGEMVWLPWPLGWVYRSLFMSCFYVVAGSLLLLFVTANLDLGRKERERRRFVGK